MFFRLDKIQVVSTVGLDPVYTSFGIEVGEVLVTESESFPKDRIADSIGFSNWNVSFSGGGSHSDTEVALAGGVIYPLDDQISFYGELAHIDNLFISLGARYQF